MDLVVVCTSTSTKLRLLGGPANVEFNFSSELVIKRVVKTIVLMDTIVKINDPQWELLLLRACVGISKLCFAMCTRSLWVFEMAQRCFDAALRSSLERIATTFRHGFVFLLAGLAASTLWGYLWRPCCISCVGIIGIKHRHNVVRDTLVDICFRSGISPGKEVDNGFGGGCDKPLRPANMLLYSWDIGLDVCVDLTWSSPLTQTGMVDFVSGRAVIEAAQRKRVKYNAKCADIRYSFLHFSFSSFGELGKDVVTLLKRVQKVFMIQDIGSCVVVHIYSRISFTTVRGLRP
uniref:Uncharacterized protein n=1 Tax=Tanacetum cinerariifolium TaxID=118510 RepID=A0A6L2KDZ4_TANCI|nr:hypothetical protein [Tanacetum cinerariifolium]